jgi:hypothetical protein
MILDGGQEDLLDLLDMQGMYREQTIAFTEYNADMLLSYDHTFEIFL